MFYLSVIGLVVGTALQTVGAIDVDTATEMYLYAWPLVMSSLTRESMFYLPDNVMLPMPVFPNPNLTAIVKPNVDTLYDACWINHEVQEDLILEVPDTTEGVYWLYPLMDAWTNIVGSPGWRTTGAGAQRVLIRGPFSNQTDPAPGEYDLVLRSPTSSVYLLGRTNVANQSDLRPTQEQMLSYRLKWGDPLFPSHTGDDTAKDTASTEAQLGTTVDDIFAMSADEFFTTFASLLTLNPPVLPQDTDIVTRMQAEYNITAGQSWAFADLSAEQRVALVAGTEKGAALMYAYPVRRVNGWTQPNLQTGAYDSDYYLRAYIALVLYAANLPQDAVYFVSEMMPGGDKVYTLEFDATDPSPGGGLPPTEMFWSVTMYSEQGFLVANEDAIYSVSSQQPLKLRTDGSVHITVSMDPPSDTAAAETNWLPAPQAGEDFQLTLRVYWPQEAILNATWTPPALVEV